MESNYFLKKHFHIIILLLLLLITFLISFKTIFNQNDLKMDFRSFFYAGRLAEKEINIYDFSALNKEDENKEYVYPFVYTPIVAQLFSIFSKCNPIDIQFVWSVLNLFMVPLIFYFSFQLIGYKKQTELLNEFGFWLILIPILILLFAPFRYIIIIGQIDLFILVLILMSIYLSNSGKDTLGGSIFALAIMLKYSCGLLLLYFLFQKKYKFTLFILVTVILVFLISYMFNPEQWVYFSDFLKNSFQNGVSGLSSIGDISNNSIFSLQFKLFGKSNILTKLSIVGILIFSYYYLFIQILNKNYKDKEFIFLLPFLILTIISTPYTWRQHFIYIVPGILVLAFYILDKFKIKKAVIYLSILFILLFFTGFNFSSKIMLFTSNELLASHNLIAALVLILFTIFVFKSNSFKLNHFKKVE